MFIFFIFDKSFINPIIALIILLIKSDKFNRNKFFDSLLDDLRDDFLDDLLDLLDLLDDLLVDLLVLFFFYFPLPIDD